MRYKVFGRHTGLRLSELVLGTGVFGTRWGHGSDPDEARGILDAYAEAGGNFIDTADSYQLGESRSCLGNSCKAGATPSFSPPSSPRAQRETAGSWSLATAARPWSPPSRRA